MAGVGQTGYWKTGVWVEGDQPAAQFGVSAVAEMVDWEGDFVLPPASGVFIVAAEATLDIAWVPEFGPPRGRADIPDQTGDADIKGDEGNIVVTDFEGHIVLPDEPPEVELP